MNDLDPTIDPETSGADLRSLLGMSKRPPPIALQGDVIGHYRIIEELGAGGMGRVYRAHDARLQRDVAVKLLARSDFGDEGVALAKLSHPHVVAVFDVGTWHGHAWVAMEYVPGGTLRTWLEGARSSREILAMFHAAGQGLAAAHAAGLVHRDFKPDNVLVDRDGRARVADFGIAGAAGDGPIAGTLAFMAPEQKSGGVVDARADQYAFAVALHEALDPPPHVAAAIARALSEEPAHRFADMTELLAELVRDPARRRRRLAAALFAVLVAGAGATAAWWRGAHGIEPCNDGDALVARVWSPFDRVRAELRIGGLATPYAAEASSEITRRLDAFGTTWRAAHDGACREHRAESLSTPAFDRRTACLSTNLTSLATARDLAFGIDRSRLPDLVAAVANLPTTCDDSDVPIAIAAQVHAVDDLLARAAVERDGVATSLAERDADAALRTARALGHAPLVARALVARGRIDLQLWRGDRGAALFGEAVTQAIAGGDDALAVEAFARAVFARGTTDDPAHAAEGLALIEAFVTRLGTRAPFARALLDNNLGTLELARGHRSKARDLFARARDESSAVEGTGSLELTAISSNLALVTDDDRERTALGAALVAKRTELLGATHPLVLKAAIGRAQLIDDPRAARRAMVQPCLQLHALHPEQKRIASECGLELVWLALAANDLDGAREALPSALANDAGDQRSTMLARSYARWLDGDLAGARAMLAELAARPLADDAPWWKSLAAFDVALGELLSGTRGPRVVAAAHRLLDRANEGAPPPIIARRRQALAGLYGVAELIVSR